MNRVLILTTVFFLAFVMISCGGDDGNSGDTGNTGNTGNTGDTGDTGDSGDTGNTSDNFPSEHDGLLWSDHSNQLVWDEAVTYCKNLGGRLPTISELRTLIQNCPALETGGECGVVDNCLDCWNDACNECEEDYSGKYSVFGDTYWFWSSTELSDTPDGAFIVDFFYCSIENHIKSDTDGRVRCVK